MARGYSYQWLPVKPGPILGCLVWSSAMGTGSQIGADLVPSHQVLAASWVLSCAVEFLSPERGHVSFPSGHCLQGSHYHSLYGTCQTLPVLGSGPCAGTVARWPVCVQQKAASFAFVWPHSLDERLCWVCALVLPSGLCCRVSHAVMGALWHTESELILLPSGDGTTEGVLGYGYCC